MYYSVAGGYVGNVESSGSIIATQSVMLALPLHTHAHHTTTIIKT